jgi:hypothetical protein
MSEAEEHTSNYCCIPPHRRDLLRYDLLTCKDLDWEPLPHHILARVQCLEKLRPRGPSTDFYRIQLNDPGVLTTAEREQLTCDLYPFLLYILTHEMVHLVRLSTILDDSKYRPASVESEETRVQQISRQILSGPGAWRFGPVLDRFCIPYHPVTHRGSHNLHRSTAPSAPPIS